MDLTSFSNLASFLACDLVLHSCIVFLGLVWADLVLHSRALSTQLVEESVESVLELEEVELASFSALRRLRLCCLLFTDAMAFWKSYLP